MDNNSEAIRVLGQDEIIERLRGEPVGRIVVRRKDDMDVFPVNYVVDTSQGEPRIYLRTAEGTKLFTVNLNPRCSLRLTSLMKKLVDRWLSAALRMW